MRRIVLSAHPASCPVHISFILSDRNPKFGVWMHFGMTECRIPFSGHCEFGLVSRICIESVAYLLYSLR